MRFLSVHSHREALARLGAGPFAGAAAEFTKALREQETGETKDAIADACKSYESTLKILTGVPNLAADKRSQALLVQGYLDDLPDNVREGFRQAVLMSLPFIRNKLPATVRGRGDRDTGCV